jgi:hypothetical protein
MKQSPMKHLLLVFQLIAAGLIVKGQAVWAPQGATWYYSYGNFAVTGYVRIKYVGDSIINGQSCKALEKKRYWFDFILSKSDSAVIDTTFTYLKNDSVFYYFNNQFYLLYDFNGQPSDVWQVAEPDTFCTEDSSATVQVDSIGTMTINATTLKWLSVNPTPNSHYGYYGQIIERIGCYDFYMRVAHLGATMIVPLDYTKKNQFPRAILFWVLIKIHNQSNQILFQFILILHTVILLLTQVNRQKFQVLKFLIS